MFALTSDLRSLDSVLTFSPISNKKHRLRIYISLHLRRYSYSNLHPQYLSLASASNNDICVQCTSTLHLMSSLPIYKQCRIEFASIWWQLPLTSFTKTKHILLCPFYLTLLKLQERAIDHITYQHLINASIIIVIT